MQSSNYHQTDADNTAATSSAASFLARVKGILLSPAAEWPIIDREDTLYGAPPPKGDEEWVWQLAPRPEAHRYHSYHRRVVGVVDVKASA